MPANLKKSVCKYLQKNLAFFDDSIINWKLEEKQFKLLMGVSLKEIKRTLLIISEIIKR